MDFYALVDQIIDLLKQRGRVSYRALKMQFALSDEGVEALKDELIYAQHLAVDEQERILVWTGNGGTNTEPMAQRVQTPPQPVSQETQPTTAPPQTDHHTPDAEVRSVGRKEAELPGRPRGKYEPCNSVFHKGASPFLSVQE